MDKAQKQVMEFHEKFGHPVADSPKLIPELRRFLRHDLIEEELKEFRVASSDENLVAVADALGDLLYVVYGAALEYGIDMESVVDEIHKSNMTKLGADGKPALSRFGKILKGPNYQPPNLKLVLAEQKWL